jgi:hypothetical protein
MSSRALRVRPGVLGALASMVSGCGWLLPEDAGRAPAGVEVAFETVAVGVACENGFSVERLKHAPDGTLLAEFPRGVLKDRANGQSWHRVDIGDPGFEGLSFLRDPAWQAIHFADDATWTLRSQPWRAGPMPLTIAVTEDAGATWQTAVVNDDVGLPGDPGRPGYALPDGRFVVAGEYGLHLAGADGRVVRFLSPSGTMTLAGRRAIFAREDRPGWPPVLFETANLDDPAVPDARALEVPLPNREDPGRPDVPTRVNGPAAIRANGTLAVAAQGFLSVREADAWRRFRLPTEPDHNGDLVPSEVGRVWLLGDDAWFTRNVSSREGGTGPVTFSTETFRIRGALGGGSGLLERVRFAAGDERFDGPIAMSEPSDRSPDGPTLLLKVDPTLKRSQTLVCHLDEAAPAVADLVTGSPTAWEPGRLYLHARRGAFSEIGDRFALRDDGHAFVANWRHLLGAPPPAKPLLDVNARYDDPGARISGLSVARGLEVFVNTFGRDTQTPELRMLQVSPLLGTTFSDTLWQNAPAPGRATQPLGDVYAVSHIEDETLLATLGGTWPRSASEPRRAVSRPLPGIAVASPAGYAIYKRKIGARRVHQRPELGWVTVLGLARLSDGELPAEGACDAERGDVDGCILYPGEATQVAMDSAGWLYVVDGRQGLVARRHRDGEDWETVADGLIHPSDLILREEGGATRVYVLDGDVWAFEVHAGVVASRRAASAMAPYLSLFRDPAEERVEVPLDGWPPRDLDTCTRGAEPCFSPSNWDHGDANLARWKGFILIGGDDTDASVCLRGEGFGTSGTLFAEGRPVPTYNWSDSNLCFRSSGVPSTPMLGTLWVKRADGRSSQAAPYVIVDTRPGAPAVFPKPPALPWADKTARVLTSCRSGRAEGCAILIYGNLEFLPQPLVAKIGGRDAPLLSKRHASYVFAWPEGLPPGRHAFDLEGLTGEVELVDHDKKTLARAYVDGFGVPFHGQAMAVVGSEPLAVIREGNWTARSDGTKIPNTITIQVTSLDAGGRHGVLPDDQVSLSEDLPRLISEGDGALLAVRRARYTRNDVFGSGQTTINDYRLVQPVTAGLFRMAYDAAGVPRWTALPDVVIPDGSASGALLAVASHAGEPWVVLAGAGATETFLMRLTAEGWVTGATVPGEALHVTVEGARLHVVTASHVHRVDLGAEVPAGPAIPLPDGVRVAGPDGEGLVVVTEAGGVAALHALGRDAEGFSRLAELPAVPGLFTDAQPIFPGVPAQAGLSAVVGDGARVWVAVARRTVVDPEQGTTFPEDRGLRLLRWEAGRWVDSGDVADGGIFPRCTGAIWDDASRTRTCYDPDGRMKGGCAPFACQVESLGHAPRRAAAGNVSLMPRAGRIEVLFDSVFGPLNLDGGADTQRVTW